jgi:ankyrin repeat protein
MPSFREAPTQSLRVELGDLFDAISRGNLGIVRDLITTDHNIAKACDSEGITPLHKLAQQPLVEAADEIALALLHGGADPNAGDVSGVTPLHWLSCRPWGIGVAQILLEWGANPMAEDNQGRTPFDSALRTSFMFGSAMVTLLNRYRYGR